MVCVVKTECSNTQKTTFGAATRQVFLEGGPNGECLIFKSGLGIRYSPLVSGEVELGVVAAEAPPDLNILLMAP